jgi:hypothetical protein
VTAVFLRRAERTAEKCTGMVVHVISIFGKSPFRANKIPIFALITGDY